MARRLPVGYIEVEYIQSSGSQYIDTGYNPSNNTRVLVKYTALETTSNYTWVVAGRTINAAGDGFGLGNNSSKYIISDYGGDRIITPVIFQQDNTYLVDKNKNIIDITVNDVTTTKNHTEKTFTAGYSLYLFGIHNGSAGFTDGSKIKMYYCKIWDDNELVADFIPCKHNNEIGMYDLVTQQFYTNSGTGSFIAGPEVITEETVKFTSAKVVSSSRLPSEYQEVDYIEDDLRAYINTGIVMKETHKISCEFSSNGATTGTNRNYIFGAASYATGVQFSYSTFSFFGVAGKYIQNGSLTIDTNKHLGEVYNDKIYLDGEEIQLPQTGQAAYSTPLSIYLFTYNYPSYTRTVTNKIYNYKMWDNDVLILDLIPCYIKSTQEYGMYDLVSNQFYSNSGTGSFTGGEEVITEESINFLSAKIIDGSRLPSEYQEVEYIEGTGVARQIIITEVNPSLYNNFTKIIDFEYTRFKSGGDFNELNGYFSTARNGYVCSNNKTMLLYAIGSGTITIHSNLDTIVGKRYNYSFTHNKTNNTLVITDNNTGSEVINTTYSGNINKGNELLFNVGASRASTYAKIYHFAMIGNDELVADFIPCYRKSDNEYGMYDLVTKKFYSCSVNLTGGSPVYRLQIIYFKSVKEV